MLDKGLGRGTVEMGSDGIDLMTLESAPKEIIYRWYRAYSAVTAAAHEVLHPLSTTGGVRSSGGDELVSLILQWVQVLPPQGAATRRRQVRLALLVRSSGS